MFAEGVGLALLTRNPLPDLLCSGGVGEDDQMFKDTLGDFAFDLLPDVTIGDAGAMEHTKAALFSDGIQVVGYARDFETFCLPRYRAVATEFFDDTS